MKTRSLFLLLLAVPLIALACVPVATPVAPSPTPALVATPLPTPTPPPPAPKRGGTLVNYLFRAPLHFSPLEVLTFVVAWPTQNVHSQLFYFDPQAAPEGLHTVLPDLAESWKWSPDGLTLTVPLRKGVKWHDGKPFTAKDVKWTGDAILAKPSVSPFGKTWWINVESLDVLDDYTVQFKMKQPHPAFVALLASAFMPVYPEHIKPITKMQTELLGTGPFKFVSYRPGELLVVERNPDFYLPGLPYLDRIEFPIIAELSTRLAALAAGRVDLSNALDITPAALRDLKAKNPDLVAAGSVTTLHDVVYFDLRKSPTNDSRFRRAVMLALDRDAWNTVVYEGNGVPGTSVLHPPYGAWGLPVAEREPLIKPDREKARQLLAEIGYKPDRALEIIHRPFPASVATALWFVEQVSKVGIKAKPVTLEPAVLTARRIAGEFDIGADASGLVVDDPDQQFLTHNLCASFIMVELGGFCDKKLEEMIMAQSRELDPARRLKLVNDVDKYIIEQAIPRQVIGWQPDWQVMHPWVKGFVKKQVIHNQSRFERIWLDKK